MRLLSSQKRNPPASAAKSALPSLRGRKAKGDLSEDRQWFHRMDAREYRARPPDDPWPGLLLRRNDPGEDDPEHDDDVVDRHHHRDDRVGPVRRLADVRQGQLVYRRLRVPRR